MTLHLHEMQKPLGVTGARHPLLTLAGVPDRVSSSSPHETRHQQGHELQLQQPHRRLGRPGPRRGAGVARARAAGPPQPRARHPHGVVTASPPASQAPEASGRQARSAAGGEIRPAIPAPLPGHCARRRAGRRRPEQLAPPPGGRQRSLSCLSSTFRAQSNLLLQSNVLVPCVLNRPLQRKRGLRLPCRATAALCATTGAERFLPGGCLGCPG